MICVLVSHTHWDREWYRTYQSFRARLVDTVDRVLDLLAADDGWAFLLDGQAVVLEDYAEVRPQRVEELRTWCRAGRLAIGPWYVQPDSLLPSGETHVRNLLEGRRAGSAFGPVSTVAYTPDSFGHPAQFPQLFAGFGLDPFVYWRGNGDELDELPPVYAWAAPDGSTMRAVHLAAGYFAAAYLPADRDDLVRRLTKLGSTLAGSGDGPVLFMNGVDHAMPDSHTREAAAWLADATGWMVRRGLLEDFAALLPPAAGLPRFSGELVGGRVTNLLPGVWSARLPQKIRNRQAETALTGWAEPWAALGAALGLPSEQPSLRLAWRTLLKNQAHDSIGGCSQDRVHEQMEPRYDAAIELAGETTRRVLERLAGLGAERRVPWTDEIDVAVFNPSPVPRTEAVRFAFEGHPAFEVTGDAQRLHPATLASLVHRGVTVDGAPARVLGSADTGRLRVIPEQVPWDVEFVAAEVPAFGWRRYHLAPGPDVRDEVDSEPTIVSAEVEVTVAPDGTLTVRFGPAAGERTYAGLLAVEDQGDRGDTYDFDPAGDAVRLEPATVVRTRRRHPTGIQELTVERTFTMPVSLSDDRRDRNAQVSTLDLSYTVRIVPGVARVDLDVELVNRARDHRLRLLFPTGDGGERAIAATTFGVAERRPGPVPAARWVHPAPATFASQGWVAANGLGVAAPGLPEAEFTADGTIAVTLLRSVGWLARMDLRSRPVPAGPGLSTPGAQCLGSSGARLSVFPVTGGAGDVSRSAAAADLGLRAVPAGPEPLLQPGASLLTVEGDGVVLSALKPAEDGSGVILRLLNVTGEAQPATVTARWPWSRVLEVRLDESAGDDPVRVVAEGSAGSGQPVELTVPGWALLTLLFAE